MCLWQLPAYGTKPGPRLLLRGIGSGASRFALRCPVMPVPRLRGLLAASRLPRLPSHLYPMPYSCILTGENIFSWLFCLTAYFPVHLPAHPTVFPVGLQQQETLPRYNMIVSVQIKSFCECSDVSCLSLPLSTSYSCALR